MSARHNRVVHTLASICLVPKVLMELPKAAVETVKVFAEDVKEEMDYRTMVVRSISREES